ncbi:MAG: [FeFe] hydrogenase H-cluster maturation GTPase HydF [Deltaproteobacteria bacterium]|nr:[FeFe] hydrogenase H-cluster maturation GTPase HydF [Deltaproteobacteria bacterium]
MFETPKASRTVIAILGRVNSGKSTLMNAICDQDVSITSSVPGTTTDIVEKSVELCGFGPVLFLDTPGDDDRSVLGARRLKKLAHALERVDAAIYLIPSGSYPIMEDEEYIVYLMSRNIPVIGVISFKDIGGDTSFTKKFFADREIPFLEVNSFEKADAGDLIKLIIRHFPKHETPSILSGLDIGEGVIVTVVPVDSEAPAGRLILPQSQFIRGVLDAGRSVLAVRDKELREALKSLREPPALVITDSQAYGEIRDIVPEEVPLTSFSILYASIKGDLGTFISGMKALERGDVKNVHIAEACSHNVTHEDIGRVKIPKFLKEKLGHKIAVTYSTGRDFSYQVRPDVVIHCGGCMLTKREMFSRLEKICGDGIPVTNFGLVIAWYFGILERVVSPYKKAVGV